PVWLAEKLDVLVLDRYPMPSDVEAPTHDLEVVGIVGIIVRQGDWGIIVPLDAKSIVWGSVRAGDIEQRRAKVLGLGHRALIPVGVEDDPALLHLHGGVVL